MIDIHSHILPGIDDGAVDVSDSLTMLKKAIEDGITTIVATPHYNIGFMRCFHNTKENIIKDVEKLKKLVIDNNLEIEIVPGQEIRIHPDLIKDFDEGKILPYGLTTKYVLIEFPFTNVPSYANRLLYEIQQRGFIPVIAHPERCRGLKEQPELLFDMIQAGAITQITAASILGKFGKETQIFTQQLIEADQVHLVATDAHNTTERSFNLDDAYCFIRDNYGIELVDYYKNNARLLITGNSIDIYDASPIKKKKKFILF